MITIITSSRGPFVPENSPVCLGRGANPLHSVAPNASPARLSYPGVRSECRVTLVIPSLILGINTCEAGRPEVVCAVSPTKPFPCHGDAVRRTRQEPYKGIGRI